jgi:hypothetical protein
VEDQQTRGQEQNLPPSIQIRLLADLGVDFRIDSYQQGRDLARQTGT